MLPYAMQFINLCNRFDLSKVRLNQAGFPALKGVYPLHLNSSIHILHNVLYIFIMVLH